MSKQFKQLFILIASVKGTAIPVAFGYLPDKKELSYYLFLYLIVEALGNQADAIKRLTGRTTCYLKVKTMTSDFELGIINGRLFIFFSFKFHIFIQHLNRFDCEDVSSTGPNVSGARSSQPEWFPTTLMTKCFALL